MRGCATAAKLLLLTLVVTFLAELGFCLMHEAPPLSSQERVETCLRAKQASPLMVDNLPPLLRDPVLRLAKTHGMALETMIERQFGMTSLTLLEKMPFARSLLGLPDAGDRPVLASLPKGRGARDQEEQKGTTVSEGDAATAVSLLELQLSTEVERRLMPSDCIVLGVIATLCTLLATFAIYNFLFTINYLRRNSDIRTENMVDEFRSLVNVVSTFVDGQDTQRGWSLPPSGFTEEEKKLYMDWLAEKTSSVGGSAEDSSSIKAYADKIPKFKKRRQQEKEAYEDFLAHSVYVKNPVDRSYPVKVLIPALVYLILHASSYVSAYELGRI